MQKLNQLVPTYKILARAITVIGAIFWVLALTVNAKAGIIHRDTSVSASLRTQLASLGHLNYPRSVERFYQQTQHKLAWIAPDTVITHAWDAMLLLDCALQYGLSPLDYHYKEILYEQLNAMMAPREKISNQQKALYDVLLTDAMISMVNNLHFGKLNPVYTAQLLDEGNAGNCKAVEVLIGSLKQKDFIHAIEITQPASKAYRSLQGHLRLVVGLNANCYEVPPGDIKLMSINMERLRWIVGNDSVYISINIPTYTLNFHQTDTAYQFKVIVGKPATPTPLVQSKITAIDKSRSSIRFKLSDNAISMAGTSDKSSMMKKTRAFSEGDIQVTESPRLAALMLKNNLVNLTAINQAKHRGNNAGKLFTLKKPMPVRVTYLTCEVGLWSLIRYKDVYHLDELLEKAFYETPQIIARRSK
ncbi:hypothetical protein ACFQ3S_07555 [Mucilaginibacter terrae]|uniref:hypothetical protein n=1 Tax=Mucilaginibacter terrae TaxID=1955052 RepID=UPI00362EAA11